MNFNFKKRFGQNFLINQHVINKICDCFEKFEEIYEIGPGMGALTKELLRRGKRINAIEIDEDCIRGLNALGDVNLNLISCDVLEFKFEKKLPIVSNLPYNIGTKIIENLVKEGIEYGVFMLQKEVAQRILDASSSKLGVFVQSLYNVEKLLDVSAKSFVPAPKVQSQVIILKRNAREIDLEKLEYIVGQLYAQRRKKISHIKNKSPALFERISSLGWNLHLRAEQIKKEDYYALVDQCADMRF